MTPVEKLRQDGQKRASWLDSDTPGLFARIAEIGDADFLEEFVGPIVAYAPGEPIPAVPQMNSWAEAIVSCRRIAASFPEIARAEEVPSDRAFVHHFLDQARKQVVQMTNNVISAGEISISLGDDLLLRSNPHSRRAWLVGEMTNALREGWRFSQCSWCEGWHRIRRARPEGRGFCSRRCITAERQARTSKEAA
jgi:hypothetical protein